MLAVLKTRAVQVIGLIALYLISASFLPLIVHQTLYTISLLIKDLLLWVLPISIAFFIGHSISIFQKKALLFIISLALFEMISNFCSVSYAFCCGELITKHLSTFPAAQQISLDFSPLWRLAIQKPIWWSADKGALFGVFLGFLSSFIKASPLIKILSHGKNCVEWVITKVFAKMIPIFILGFVARMHQLNLLTQMLNQYGTLLLWLILFLIFYITALFILGNGLSFHRAIKNLLPAGTLAFTSGCSISTMPWTIKGTAKNLKTPSFAEAVIPTSTNVQQIGDCIANAFLCFLIYRNFFGLNPSIEEWAQFSVVFVLARFATAAVIGGAIFLMLPIYEKYLHFTPEMIAIILAFNVILDPIITTSNVMANGALCSLFERAWSRLSSVFDRQSHTT